MIAAFDMTFTQTRRWIVLGGLATSAASCAPAVISSVSGTERISCEIVPDSVGAHGFDPVAHQAVLETFEESEANFHGLAIWRAGAQIAERYRMGQDSSVGRQAAVVSFDVCTLHDVRSISKSVVSLLWGIADGRGETPPLDTTVLSLYPELVDLARDGREAITIKHLLTMSTGLEWNEEQYGSLSNPETALFWRTSQVRHTLRQRVSAPPGQIFNYCGGNTAILADLLIRYTGRALPEYADEHLFAPLGVRHWEWVCDYRGRPLAFAGLRLTPRDLLKIGRLVLTRGAYEGRAVVPTRWVDEATSVQMATGDGLHYGYQWWLGEVAARGEDHSYVAGFGNGGQRLFVVPSLDLVVAMTAGNYGEPEQRLSNVLFRQIAASLI